MASTQGLRKQEHLEAGKRRLEEFRKKKAAERAKKTTSNTQGHGPDVGLEKKPLETEFVRQTESNGAGTSDAPGKNDIEPAGVTISNHNKATDLSQKGELSTNGYNVISGDEVLTHGTKQETRTSDSGLSGPATLNHGQVAKQMYDDFHPYRGAHVEPPYGVAPDQSIVLHSEKSQDFGSVSTQSSFNRLEESQSKERSNYLKDFTMSNPITSQAFAMDVSPQNSGSNHRQTNPSNAGILDIGRTFSYEESVQPSTNMRGSSFEVVKNMYSSTELKIPFTFNMGGGGLDNSSHVLPSVDGQSTGSSSDVRISSSTEINSRKSRPSFLDSLVPRPSSGSLFQRTEAVGSSMANGFKHNRSDDTGPSAFQNSLIDTESSGPVSKQRTPSAPIASGYSNNSSVSTSNGVDLTRPFVRDNSTERKHDFYSSKQNEDFSALEQHIEDLTQEKFSLQRALDASQVLAESLATENSSLTDSYNQQRSVVNQLKSDMERLQEDINARLEELESFKQEYVNVRLECNAADERAKLLASEVIGLEEKALKLRSSELKLERQLENSHTEISSCKKKVSSLERERQDLQMTMDALKEEKKTLQSKLRKASVSDKLIDVGKSPDNKKNMSTSTEDLDKECSGTISDTSNQEIQAHAASTGTDAPGFPSLFESGLLNLEDASSNLPPDQMRMIENINQLISELALEKEELLQTLTSKSSESSRLKDLNKELSRKLETQTQRLELLTAQSMATSNVPARIPDSGTTQDDIAYADEGDEVVERVLGWIMKLFPGGPSKRRTSKLL